MLQKQLNQSKKYFFNDIIHILLECPGINLSRLQYCKQQLDKYITNKVAICTCGKIMIERPLNKCYEQSQAIMCDFSLKDIKTDILHCPDEKNCNHPFGFDIGKDQKENYDDRLY